MRSPKDVALTALRVYRGDDAARAHRAFCGLTSEQMDQEHGQSGRTRREVLAGYEERIAEIDAAIAWVNARDDGGQA